MRNCIELLPVLNPKSYDRTRVLDFATNMYYNSDITHRIDQPFENAEENENEIP